MRVERRAEEIHSRPTDCGARHVVIRNAKEWQLRPLPERGRREPGWIPTATEPRRASRAPCEGRTEVNAEQSTQTLERILERGNLQRAYRAVRRNRGAAGVDGKDIATTGRHLKTHWPRIAGKLREGSYTPSPVRGVRIPKAGGGERVLGIPTVQDRLIQQALAQVLSASWEGSFSGHSYGYRPGRSAHDAVRAAQGYVREGKDWVVDLDISAFFDHVNHDILMQRVSEKEGDKRVLRLIGRYLRAGIEMNGRRERRTRGVPQGGPLSPLLANIYLDPLDKELERRGLSFCRYADDVAIYVASERSAQRVLASVSTWVERHLKLQVNRAKSGTGRPWERKYLGFTLGRDGQIRIAPSSAEHFKAQVRTLWDARQSRTSRELARQWQAYLRGWCGYFGLAEGRWAVGRWEGWVRRHIRKCFWLRWHDRKGRLNALKRLGARPYHWGVASSRRGAWRIARSPALQTVLSRQVLQRHGLWVPSDLWAAAEGR